MYEKEKHLYHPDVIVRFNDTAYNNEVLFKEFIEDELLPYTNNEDTLLVMDVAAFYKTPGIMDLLKESCITPAMIPPGTTSLLQPLDIAVNGPFKQWLRDYTDDYINTYEDLHGPVEKWDVSRRRIMVTHIVA